MVSPNPSAERAQLASLLVERAKRGDQAAFCELVKRYRGRIVALALHLTGSVSEADDIAQEVFLKAYQKLDSFEGRSEFFTWVYRMAVNRSLNARRDQSRRNEAPIEDPRVDRAVAIDAGGDPARAAELRQSYGRLISALDRLPADMRTSVVLVVLQGLSHDEAAVVQACASGTVAWRIHEARARLRKAMDSPRLGPARGEAGLDDLASRVRSWLAPPLPTAG